PRISRYQGGAAKQNPTPSPSPGAHSGPSGAPSPGPSAPKIAPGTPGPTVTTRGPQGSVPSNAPGRTPSRSPDATPAKSRDELGKQELERRADPKLKADYAKGVGQVDILRIQALQYTFQATGFWHIVVETFTAKTSFVDHGNQIYWANPYRGGKSWVDTLQAFIEGARGVLHLIGDVASVISAWAGLAALVTGALALAFSETVIGGISFGAMAGASAEVAIIAAAIKLLADFIDVLLGLVQMIILIIRARNEKDPNERARLAQLLHKESSDLASNVVSIG